MTKSRGAVLAGSNYARRMRAEGRSTAEGRKYLLSRKIAKVRRRALRDGIEFSLRVADVEMPECCPVLGIPLDYTSLDNTPSFDRIDATGPYSQENVRVVSMRANTLRGNGKWHELLDIAFDSVRMQFGEAKAREAAAELTRILSLGN